MFYNYCKFSLLVTFLPLQVKSDVDTEQIVFLWFHNFLQNAPTHSLFGVVNRILDESTDRKNGDISHVRICYYAKHNHCIVFSSFYPIAASSLLDVVCFAFVVVSLLLLGMFHISN